MERLSIASFLENDHPYHLYVYDDVKGIPRGTTVKDGNEILPASQIFQYKDGPSYAAFSNFFRYKLLLGRGGWWVDTDTVCLEPFDLGTDYVFSSEWYQERNTINCGIIKVPAASPVMAHAWQVCRTKDRETLKWGEAGPRLMGEAVKKYGLTRYVQPPVVFCPFPFKDWARILEPMPSFEFHKSTIAVHLWNGIWGWNGQDKNREYHPDCIYERLKKRYLR